MVNRILLTGAGFTNNFGAPLANEVSTLMFNSTDNPILLDLLRNDYDYDYENIYQKVMQSKDYDETIKNEFTAVINNAYQTINTMITVNPLSQYVCPIKFKELIKAFNKQRDAGFIFTLNQDLFFENNINNNQFFDLNIKIPIDAIENPDTEKTKQQYEKKFDINEPNIFYIKLHGSQNWLKKDTIQMMIIGHGKNEQIKNEPLLEWNMKIFKSALKKSNTKLLVIGYSFRDKHINQLIYEHRDTVGLYIINPQPLESFFNTLTSQSFGSEIKSLIKKYYPVNICQLIGLNAGQPHLYWGKLHTEFFDT